MKEARVYFNRHPLYLVGPLHAYETGEMVKIPAGRGTWYAKNREKDQEAQITGPTQYNDGAYTAVVACPDCDQYHLGDCEEDT